MQYSLCVLILNYDWNLNDFQKDRKIRKEKHNKHKIGVNILLNRENENWGGC